MAPAGVDSILAQITQTAREALGDNLGSVVLYGSHARGEAVPGSDINLLLIVKDSRAGALEPLTRHVPHWLKQGVTAPVIFEMDQLARSHDTFALELAEMAATHRVLWGEDPFAGYTPAWDAVRHELEHESRQKTIYLKRRWLAAGGEEQALRGLLRDTVPGFLALLRGTLLFKKRALSPVTLEAIHAELRTYCEWFEPDLWQRLRRAARGLEKVPAKELAPLVAAYIEQARSFVRYVDAMTEA